MPAASRERADISMLLDRYHKQWKTTSQQHKETQQDVTSQGTYTNHKRKPRIGIQANTNMLGYQTLQAHKMNSTCGFIILTQ